MMRFLEAVAANNNRAWFQKNKAWYDDSRKYFEQLVEGLLVRIRQFDDTVAHLGVKDCTYRFYRDTRFSPDKAPYKRHFGAYICCGGRKSLMGGYYFHLQPGECMLASGTWYLPSDILKEVRMSVVEDLSTFRGIVEVPEFKAVYPEMGMDFLKTLPRGFDKDFECPDYIRPRIYACMNKFDEALFDSPDALDEIARRFQVGYPFIDFINDTIGDYSER